MAIGSVADVINAKNVELVLNPTGSNDEYILLQEIAMPLSRPETSEAVFGGTVYFYGKHDNAFDATFLLSSNDVGKYLDNNALVNGAMPVNTYRIRLTSKANNVANITVTAVTPNQDIEKLPTGGVKLRQRFRITEDVDSSNVS